MGLDDIPIEATQFDEDWKSRQSQYLLGRRRLGVSHDASLIAFIVLALQMVTCWQIPSACLAARTRPLFLRQEREHYGCRDLLPAS